jgi:hypothetical protein
MPAQKAEPAPVSSTQATWPSVASPPSASASASRSSIDSALRFSGRSSVMVASGPSRSTRRSPGMRARYPAQLSRYPAMKPSTVADATRLLTAEKA